MFCTNCGKDVGEQMKFCPYCGEPVYQGQQEASAPAAVAQQPAAAPVSNVVPDLPEDVGKPFHSGLATAIVFTVLALLTVNVLALITGILAIVFSGIASSRRSAGNMPSARSNAKAAKALNITTIILTILWIVMIVALIAASVHLSMEMLQNGTLEELQNLTPQQIEEYLSHYGYHYDAELIEEFLENDGSVWGAQWILS